MGSSQTILCTTTIPCVYNKESGEQDCHNRQGNRLLPAYLDLLLSNLLFLSLRVVDNGQFDSVFFPFLFESQRETICNTTSNRYDRVETSRPDVGLKSRYVVPVDIVQIHLRFLVIVWRGRINVVIEVCSLDVFLLLQQVIGSA